MISPSSRTFSISLFLIILYANAEYIIFYFGCGQPFVVSNIFAMLNIAIAGLAIFIAFTSPKYFWLTVLFFFFLFPFQIFVQDMWFPDIIYVDIQNQDSYHKPAQNLGLPVLLLVHALITYFLIYRRENVV